LRGVVRETWVGGVRVFSRDGGVDGEKEGEDGAGPVGRLILEARTA